MNEATLAEVPLIHPQAFGGLLDGKKTKQFLYERSNGKIPPTTARLRTLLDR